MANLFPDSAVFHQFMEYLKERESKNQHNLQKRETKENIQKQMEEFIRDVYPGSKSLPNELIDLMTSPDPQKAMNIQANLNTEEDKCSEESESATQNHRKKRSASTEKHTSPRHSQRKKRSTGSTEIDDFGCPNVNFNGEACKKVVGPGGCPNGGWTWLEPGPTRRKCIGFHVSTSKLYD